MHKHHPEFAILALSAIAALPGCDVGVASSETDEIDVATPIPVEVAYPIRADIFATYHATTTISSDAEASVLARVPGELVRLFVEEGDHVAQGQVLARLDGERLRLEMLEAGAKLEQARKDFQRYTDLAERGLVSASMFDGLKYEVHALLAGYELRKLNYNYATIRAPIAGIVSSRDVKLGQSVEVNAKLFHITDTSELVAYLQIPQSELAKFSAGHTATLQVAAMPGVDFTATIVRISPTINISTGTFRATAFVDNLNNELAPGMFARFSIAYEKHHDALIIPAAAIVEEDDQTSVYVVTNGQAIRRIVATGIAADDQVEILAGLADGEEIIVVGHTGLRDGSKVIASNQTPGNFTG